MEIWSSLSGLVDIAIISADPSQLISRLAEKGICVSNVCYIDTITIQCTIRRNTYPHIKELAEKQGAQIQLLSRRGVYWLIKGLKHRPVLMLGIALIIALVLYLPTKVLFIEVTGNANISTQMLTEKATQCGIFFGASRADVRSERVKNALLSAVPELQWAGINTRGCVAVLSVRERNDLMKSKNRSCLDSVVATQDGVIEELTVFKGNPMCKVGQAVKKGQLLVSAYSDYGTVIKATGAEAEVIAQTGRQLKLVTPTKYSTRKTVRYEKKRYSLLIGKKLINFLKDSGISDAECDRIYSQQNVVLPGGFRLPFAIVKEQCTYYDIASENTDDLNDFCWLQKTAQEYLRCQMLAGEIIDSKSETEMVPDLCKFYGTYRCREMIGCIRREEIIQDNA